ncbi:MAG: hypothetical protein II951_08880 [Bacteroidales bacterium]|nr:hypothetical protein [Bacteroidales bacterium]
MLILHGAGLQIPLNGRRAQIGSGVVGVVRVVGGGMKEQRMQTPDFRKCRQNSRLLKKTART